MKSPEDISALASVMAIVALFNWWAGDRSFRGERLLIRQGPPWIVIRWLGVGLWAASVIATTKGDVPLEYAGFVGAAFLLFGTARKKSAEPIFQLGPLVSNGESRV